MTGFFRSQVIAVVGASRNKRKLGSKVCRRLKGFDRFTVRPVNPAARDSDGGRCHPDLENLPKRPDAVIFITPPAKTASVVREALGLGIGVFWMQPGAEGPEAVRLIKGAGTELVRGRCALVTDPKEFYT